MNRGYYNLRRKMHIITASKASNIFFIPGIITIRKDKSFWCVSMHMIGRMYAWMVSYKMSNDLRDRVLGVLCIYSRRPKSLAQGGLTASPTVHPSAQTQGVTPTVRGISWKATPRLPKVTAQHVNINRCQIQIIFTLQRESCKISGQLPADPVHEPCYHPWPSDSNLHQKR